MGPLRSCSGCKVAKDSEAFDQDARGNLRKTCRQCSMRRSTGKGRQGGITSGQRVVIAPTGGTEVAGAENTEWRWCEGCQQAKELALFDYDQLGELYHSCRDCFYLLHGRGDEEQQAIERHSTRVEQSLVLPELALVELPNHIMVSGTSVEGPSEIIGQQEDQEQREVQGGLHTPLPLAAIDNRDH
ncbi:hypothetical protein HOY80DRAFT_1051825 [Tuber brumale]|nr:hypothetical protein HOY80DRAFT_1051825 [Tuber brumale]